MGSQDRVQVRRAVDAEAGKLAGRYIGTGAGVAREDIWRKAMKLTGGKVRDVWVHSPTSVSVPSESIEDVRVRRELGLR